jgi:hypothetical protein
MSSFLLGLTLLAVAWLAIWSVKDHTKPSKTWWPFAMREPVASKTEAGQQPTRSSRDTKRTSKPPQRPWRRSGS